MPDPDIFDDNKVTTPAKDADDKSAAPATDDNKNATDQLLSSVVNEDGTKKYGNLEDFAKGAANAQDHIKKLESELAEVRNKGNASDKLDELLDAVKESKGSGQGDDTSTMKPEDVLGIVQDYLKDNKAAETREDNISTVTKVFRDRYGKDASDKLYAKSDDLGFSREEINRMIANNPNAALKVLGEDKAKAKTSDPVGGEGGVATSQFTGKPTPQAESIMGPTSSKQLTDAFAASKRRTLERLGYNPDEVKYS